MHDYFSAFRFEGEQHFPGEAKVFWASLVYKRTNVSFLFPGSTCAIIFCKRFVAHGPKQWTRNIVVVIAPHLTQRDNRVSFAYHGYA